MNKEKRHSIPAFTIFEVTIVMAIMSIIVSMVSFSVNRLFDQMRVSEEIHAELNTFYKVRSTLWYDCITADSVIYNDKQLSAYKDKQEINYAINEGYLTRTKAGGAQELKVPVLSMESLESEEGSEIILTFDWKGEPLPWRFFNRPDFAQSVNQFFDKRNG